MSEDNVKPPLFDPNKKLMVEGWLDEYLEKVLTTPQLKYMLLKASINSGYVYVKITDQLRPKMFLFKDSYLFNTTILFREPICNFYSYSNKSQKEFNEYMKKTFDPNGYIENFIQNLK